MVIFNLNPIVWSRYLQDHKIKSISVAPRIAWFSVILWSKPSLKLSILCYLACTLYDFNIEMRLINLRTSSKFQLLRENWLHACMASRSLDRSGQGFYYYFRVLARDILCKNEFRTQCGLKQISQNESNPETLNMEWQEISDYHLAIVLFIKRYKNEVTLVDAIILWHIL